MVCDDGLYGGQAFRVERTGGNCTALVHETSDGGHLVVTNGSGSHDTAGPVVVSRFITEGWHDGAEPDSTCEGTDADALVSLVLNQPGGTT